MTLNVSSEQPMQQSKEIAPHLENDQLLTIRQFCSSFPWPSESALRAYIYRACALGLQEAFTRVGRRILINPKKFFELIKQIQSQPKQEGNHVPKCVSKNQAFKPQVFEPLAGI